MDEEKDDFTALMERLGIERLLNPPPVVSVLRLDGVIGGLGFGRRGLTLDALSPAIERAFKPRRLKAVALAVNSPGGSAVQSALIARRIRSLAEEKEVPVIAFCEDVAASGGYWLACAADEIYADDNSIVGSIGVISASFGFPELLKRIGVERRLHTAGDKKSLLDPFLAEKAAEVKRLKDIQKDIHDNFQEMVRERRAAKLKAADKTLFSGQFWTGAKALELGLIDGLGDLRPEIRRRYGEDVKFKVVRLKRPWWKRRFGLSSPGVAESLEAVEERLLWSRFGL